MPIDYARKLTTRERTAQANRHLGYTLAFVAGAANAGGFLAVRQYTSHMTGIVSSMADSVSARDWGTGTTPPSPAPGCSPTAHGCRCSCCWR
jgi:hypothetical protein